MANILNPNYSTAVALGYSAAQYATLKTTVSTFLSNNAGVASFDFATLAALAPDFASKPGLLRQILKDLGAAVTE